MTRHSWLCRRLSEAVRPSREHYGSIRRSWVRVLRKRWENRLMPSPRLLGFVCVMVSTVALVVASMGAAATARSQSGESLTLSVTGVSQVDVIFKPKTLLDGDPSQWCKYRVLDEAQIRDLAGLIRANVSVGPSPVGDRFWMPDFAVSFESPHPHHIRLVVWTYLSFGFSVHPRILLGSREDGGLGNPSMQSLFSDRSLRLTLEDWVSQHQLRPVDPKNCS